MKKYLIAIAAALLVCGAADAQLGKLGGALKDKAKQKVEQAKNAAKDKVTKTVDGAVKDAVQGAADAAGVGDVVGDVTGGGDEVGSDGSSRPSAKQIWWLEDKKFENLYNFTRPQADDKSEIGIFQYGLFIKEAGHIMNLPDQYMTGWTPAGEGSTTMVPSIEIPLYAWTKKFMDAPNLDNMKYFSRCLAFYHELVPMMFAMQDKSQGVIDTEKGWFTYFLPMDKYKDEILEPRFEEACRVAVKNIDVEDLIKFAMFRLQTATTCVSGGDTSNPDVYFRDALGYYESLAIIKFLVEPNPKFNNASENYRRYKAALSQVWIGSTDKCFYKMTQAVKSLLAPPMKLPTFPQPPMGVTDAEYKEASAAVSNFMAADGQFQKLILTGTWVEVKNNKAPFNVLMESCRGLGVVTKDGKKFCRYVNVCRKTKGAPITVQAALDNRLYPVQE